MYIEKLQELLDQYEPLEEQEEQEETTVETAPSHNRFTYSVVSKVAYLIGVPTYIFENEHEPPKMEEYLQLEKNKHARIIRNLCRLRSQIERNFGHINKAISQEYKTITSLPEWVPQDAIMALSQDGVRVFTKTEPLVQYVIELNQHISNRINNVKDIFPTWLNWDYLKDIFIMPNGLTIPGTKVAANEYYANKKYYPYNIYINWPASDLGNLLYNDKFFVTHLYEWNHDAFTDLSKVSNVSSYTRANVHEFLMNSRRTVLVVDCENSAPFSLCAALDSLDEAVMNRIQKIILYDDIHTTEAWQDLSNYTQIPVEHIQIQRVKENKSLVDVRLVTGVCREFYENDIDSFILVSSDSDYWGLISDMPRARFLVMVEHDKCGYNLKQALREHGIFYCYIDDFYSADGGSSDLKHNLLLKKLQTRLDEQFRVNLNELLSDTIHSLRISMCAAEQKQFYDRYLRTIQMRIEENGELSMEIKRK